MTTRKSTSKKSKASNKKVEAVKKVISRPSTKKSLGFYEWLNKLGIGWLDQPLGIPANSMPSRIISHLQDFSY